jgi:predicted nuclease of predicted toxin-antitoxin system
VRLLVDENVPLPTIDALRQAGHDVEAALETLAGAADELVLARARLKNRLAVG